MSSTELDLDSLRQLVTNTLLAADFRRATFGGAVRGPARSPWVRVVVRPVEVHGQRYLQFSYFDQRKNVTKNYRAPEIGPHLNEILNIGYAGIHLSTSSEEVDVRITKKGKILIGRRKVAEAVPEPSAHNRVKEVPLPEGQADRLLEVMGIMTRDGRVRPTMCAKYTQINECLKLLTHVLDEAGLHRLAARWKYWTADVERVRSPSRCIIISRRCLESRRTFSEWT